MRHKVYVYIVCTVYLLKTPEIIFTSPEFVAPPYTHIPINPSAGMADKAAPTIRPLGPMVCGGVWCMVHISEGKVCTRMYAPYTVY